MSSDSSDEENLEFLKEAQDDQFIKDCMFSENPEKPAEESSPSRKGDNLPSQRTIEDGEAQFNFLKVTPGFRKHVARKLSEILDDKLNKSLVNVEVDDIPRKKRVKGGIKLLSDSKHFLKPSKKTNDNTSVIESINLTKAPRYNKLKTEVPEELLKEAVVSPDDILGQKEVKTWSKRSKAEVYRYKTAENGQLLLVQPKTSDV